MNDRSRAVVAELQQDELPSPNPIHDKPQPPPRRGHRLHSVEEELGSQSELAHRPVPTRVRRKESTSKKRRSSSQSSSRGVTPDPKGRRFNARVDGLGALYNCLIRLYKVSADGTINWNDIRSLYRKDTGRHFNSEEMNLICGTTKRTKHELLQTKLNRLMYPVDTKGHILRIVTTEEGVPVPLPSPISSDDDSVFSRTTSVEDEELQKMTMEERRKELTESLIRQGLLKKTGERMRASQEEPAEETEAHFHVEKVDESEGSETEIRAKVFNSLMKNFAQIEEIEKTLEETDAVQKRLNKTLVETNEVESHIENSHREDSSSTIPAIDDSDEEESHFCPTSSPRRSRRSKRMRKRSLPPPSPVFAEEVEDVFEKADQERKTSTLSMEVPNIPTISVTQYCDDGREWTEDAIIETEKEPKLPHIEPPADEERQQIKEDTTETTITREEEQQEEENEQPLVPKEEKKEVKEKEDNDLEKKVNDQILEQEIEKNEEVQAVSYTGAQKKEENKESEVKEEDKQNTKERKELPEQKEELKEEKPQPVEEEDPILDMCCRHASSLAEARYRASKMMEEPVETILPSRMDQFRELYGLQSVSKDGDTTDDKKPPEEAASPAQPTPRRLLGNVPAFIFETVQNEPEENIDSEEERKQEEFLEVVDSEPVITELDENPVYYEVQEPADDSSEGDNYFEGFDYVQMDQKQGKEEDVDLASLGLTSIPCWNLCQSSSSSGVHWEKSKPTLDPAVFDRQASSASDASQIDNINELIENNITNPSKSTHPKHKKMKKPKSETTTLKVESEDGASSSEERTVTKTVTKTIVEQQSVETYEYVTQYYDIDEEIEPIHIEEYEGGSNENMVIIEPETIVGPDGEYIQARTNHEIDAELAKVNEEYREAFDFFGRHAETPTNKVGDVGSSTPARELEDKENAVKTKEKKGKKLRTRMKRWFCCGCGPLLRKSHQQ